MPRIRCRYLGCVYLDDGYCSAPLIDLDPDEGCHTYTQSRDPFEDEWDDDEGYDDWEQEELDDDAWLDEEY